MPPALVAKNAISFEPSQVEVVVGGQPLVRSVDLRKRADRDAQKDLPTKSIQCDRGRCYQLKNIFATKNWQKIGNFNSNYC
jgi:hypothetical protein